MRSSNVASVAIALLRFARTAFAASIPEFDWPTIEPSKSLNYTPCYADHKFAKLLLPLDWLDPVDNNAIVAIIARPANVDESDESFGGTIITNPGGPGSSGIGSVLAAGGLMQRKADGDHKKFEILSFDPRGVGFTTPAADCY
jgi:pimeloyl-ACP methyl ester carboxylesterase